MLSGVLSQEPLGQPQRITTEKRYLREVPHLTNRSAVSARLTDHSHTFGSASPVFAALGAVLLCLATVLGAPAAFAHAQLVSTNPANGSAVDVMPSEVVFEFNEEINKEFAQVVFTADDGSVHPATPVIEGPLVTAEVPEGVVGPTVIARFRVVSADGHPIGGETRFGIGQPPAEPDPAQATGASGNTSDSGGIPIVPLAVGGVVVLVGAGAFAATRRRPS